MSVLHKGGKNLFIFIFLKTSVEKVKYNKVKHFCRRHWRRQRSSTQWETLPVSGSNSYTLLPKLTKKWILPDLTSKRTALSESQCCHCSLTVTVRDKEYKQYSAVSVCLIKDHKVLN